MNINPRVTILIIVFCATAALLGGCATGPQIPSKLQYSPPRIGSPVATIRGSGEWRFFIIDFHAYIAKIDGKVVMAGRAGWDTPIPIEIGHHILSVELNRGEWVARSDFELDAVAGASYQLRYTTDLKPFVWEDSYVDFWITDMTTSKAVSTIKQASLVPPENIGRNPIIIPPMHFM